MAGRRISLFCLLAVLLAPIVARAQDLNEQLLAAARKSDVEAVKSLLAKGADVNAKSRYGATALSFAADRGNVDVVRVLLERGADVNVKDTFYNATPLTWAASKGHAEVTRMLLEKGAQTKEIAMSIAVQGGHVSTAQAVLSIGGFKPEALTGYLSVATRASNAEMIDLLKKAGAQPPAEFKVAPEALKLYEGKFKNGEVEVNVALKEGKLIGTVSGGQTLNLSPSAQHVFIVPEIPGLGLAFRLEGERVTAFALKQTDGSERIFQKVVAQ